MYIFITIFLCCLCLWGGFYWGVKAHQAVIADDLQDVRDILTKAIKEEEEGL